MSRASDADPLAAKGDPLTLRIDSAGGRLSRDDGSTVDLPAEQARGIYAELAQLTGNLAGTLGGLTAGAAASLAEAGRTAPRPSTAQDHPVLADPVRWMPGPEPPALGNLVPVTDIGPTRAFASVLAERRSDRVFGPLDIRTLGTALARSGLVRSRWDGADGLVESSRPAPSAGARQPMTLVVMARGVSGLPEGMWVLDPDAAVLRRVRHGIGTPDHASAAVTAALGIAEPPPAVVVTVAQPARTLSRYPTGLPLLWRETGALLATVHLAATDLGLASCIAGTSGVLFAPGGTSPGDVAETLIDTGAIAIGGSSEYSAHPSEPGA